MVYNRDIPQSTDLISISQSQILGNFQVIDDGAIGGTGFSRNHVSMTQAVDGGLHYRIEFSQSIPDAPITGTVGALYPQTLGATQELFFKNSDGSSPIHQITGPFTVNPTGFTTLQGGFKLSWGAVPTYNNGDLITALGMTTIYQPLITIEDSDVLPTVRAYVYGISTNTFRVRTTSGAPVNIKWMAIGI